MLLQTSSKVNFHIEKDSKSISLEDEKAYQWIKDHQKFTIVVPVNESPPADNLIISKFIGKVAIEALAKIGLEVEGGLNDIVDNPGLDPLKDYVRYGRGVKFWPYHARPIYSEGRYFRDDRTPEGYEVLHEFQLFQTDEQMWHFILVIFGQEYCINLAEPTVTLYQDWLKSNDNACPLYGYFNNEQF